MPKCDICDTKFYYATQLDPPEPCECGQREQASNADEYRGLRPLRNTWRAHLLHLDDGERGCGEDCPWCLDELVVEAERRAEGE